MCQLPDLDLDQMAWLVPLKGNISSQCRLKYFHYKYNKWLSLSKVIALPTFEIAIVVALSCS